MIKLKNFVKVLMCLVKLTEEKRYKLCKMLRNCEKNYKTKEKMQKTSL